MVILSKGCKPHNFESHISLICDVIQITFIQILLILNISLNQTLDVLALPETDQDDWIDSGNLSVKGYLPIIQKDSSTHMHGLAVYVKEGLPLHL